MDGARIGAPGQATGTAPYMSPNQAHGRLSRPDDDIFALRKVVYEINGHGQDLKGHTFWRFGYPGDGPGIVGADATSLTHMTPQGKYPFDFRHALETPERNPRVALAEWLRFTKNMEEHSRARRLAEKSEDEFYDWFYRRFDPDELALEVTGSLDAIKHFPHNLPVEKRDAIIRTVVHLASSFSDGDRQGGATVSFGNHEHAYLYYKEFFDKVKTLRNPDGTPLRLEDYGMNQPIRPRTER